MARTAKPPLKEKELRGFKYLRLVDEYLDRLHDVGCRRDRAGNRQLHMDQYACLVLLFLFNPQCDSLQAIRQASLLRKVQRRLWVHPTSMGSLSESVHLFGAEAVEGLIDELLGRLPRLAQPQPIADLDRGYFKYTLFQAILAAGSSFCCRLQE